MSVKRAEYANGTYLDMRYPFGFFVGGAALCSDGKVRKLKRISDTADTYFSVPASVNVGKRTVSGYITVETLNDDTAMVYFIAYSYGKNGDALPGTKYRMNLCDDPQRVTCGNCNRSWCERCDPAPAAMCHYCNGKGYSTAGMKDQ